VGQRLGRGRHVAEVHWRNRRYQCIRCEASFTRKSKAREHVSSGACANKRQRRAWFISSGSSGSWLWCFFRFTDSRATSIVQRCPGADCHFFFFLYGRILFYLVLISTHYWPLYITASHIDFVAIAPYVSILISVSPIIILYLCTYIPTTGHHLREKPGNDICINPMNFLFWSVH
jgi:hypothetical protein